ncbi:pimeloyl-ACP methyl ester carboxylesterase [Methanolinea mesophila]|uniref:alpha/beta fold hydrolase n=1 Tax=Methanolinea mesophila TaxID=547055 RepID=UPI001AE7D038|nr:alpha/beta hydrolase [Methanolinea mesophila]MBP1928919.1 pimeloyl-ACP methyl ester carboxylesterase [Methanolinea mesophila]
MPPFVLVHGGDISTDTWNRLYRRNIYPPGGHLGPHCWDGTVSFLEARGLPAFAPALGSEKTHTLTAHTDQVCRVILENNLRNVILVAHSYGSFPVIGTADRLPKKIRHLVFLDTGLPDPGQSLMDLLERAYSRSNSPPIPDPDPPYVEKIRYDPATIRRIPKTYIRCTKSDFADLTLYSKRKVDEEASCFGNWTYLEIPSSHVPMADAPEKFNRVLLSIAER